MGTNAVLGPSVVQSHPQKDSLLIDVVKRPIIIKGARSRDLLRFYEDYLSTGLVHPAQWFTDATKWYQIHTFNNPYNVGRPNAELALVLDNKSEIRAYLKNMPLVFWGVGKSDTEMEIVNFQLEKNGGTAYVIAIDINNIFLKDFANALKDKVKEVRDLKIHFLGIQNLFEEVSPRELNCLRTNNKMHVCFGNTIGNYEETNDILAVFEKHVSNGDYLLLGFQSNKLIESTIRRYYGNQYLESLFTSSLSAELRSAAKKEKISWKYNPKKEQVEAWINNIQVFRSKKFNPKRLRSILKSFGFVLEHQFKDDFATCIHLYKYLGKQSSD